MTSRNQKGRAWLKSRAPRATARGRRIRNLFRAYMAKLTPGDPLHQAAAMRAAELSVAAEDARARLLIDPSAEEAAVRLDNTARRAVEELTAIAPKPDPSAALKAYIARGSER